jgi:hypothetical protein
MAKKQTPAAPVSFWSAPLANKLVAWGVIVIALLSLAMHMGSDSKCCKPHGKPAPAHKTK